MQSCFCHKEAIYKGESDISITYSCLLLNHKKWIQLEEEWTLVSKKSNKKKKISVDAKKKPRNKNDTVVKTTKPFFVKEEMTIEPELMGFVTGRKGCNLERLKKIYGVKFILPPKGGSQLTIEGPAKMVSATKKDIADRPYRAWQDSLLKKSHIHLLIGPEGENIQALQSALYVNINIKKDGKRSLSRGKRCEEAKKTIKDNLTRITNSLYR